MGFQIIPLVMLGAYLLYASYYYAAPMFFLKVMLFLAHIRHRDIDICFEERRTIARFTKDPIQSEAIYPKVFLSPPYYITFLDYSKSYYNA